MKSLLCCHLALMLTIALGDLSFAYAQEDDAAGMEAAEQEVYDPLEGFNRGIFWFNDKFDAYVLEPVARGYDYITPRPVQTGIGNFFSNLKSPASMVADLVQFKFEDFGTHTARFLINSTIGIAGLLDVAKEFKLQAPEKDFGLALGYHGVPSGPYLVLPFLGPSNLRDTVGWGVDLVLDPTFYIGAVTGVDTTTEYLIDGGMKSVEYTDKRARLLKAVEEAKKMSFDYYLFVQSAYNQRREKRINEERHESAAGREDAPAKQ